MKLVTTKLVARRAIAPLFFVHSTLRNFILLSHLLPTLSSGEHTHHSLLACVTRYDQTWYYPDEDSEDSSSFFEASSHSSFPKCVEARSAGNGPLLPDEILMCLCASRRNANMLRLTMNAKTTRMNIVGGERLTTVRAVELDAVVPAPPPTLSGLSEIIPS